jgi:hypothetical protein
MGEEDGGRGEPSVRRREPTEKLLDGGYYAASIRLMVMRTKMPLPSTWIRSPLWPLLRFLVALVELQVRSWGTRITGVSSPVGGEGMTWGQASQARNRQRAAISGQLERPSVGTRRLRHNVTSQWQPGSLAPRLPQASLVLARLGPGSDAFLPRPRATGPFFFFCCSVSSSCTTPVTS